MNENISKHIISYRCNQCGKKRKLVLPASLNIVIDERGLAEYVDIHICKNNKLTAVICYVDSSYTVRSQVVAIATPSGIKLKTDDTNNSNSSSNKMSEIVEQLNIPLPKKYQMYKTELKIKDFEPQFIDSISIKNKLKRTFYYYVYKEEGIEFNIISQLGFIEFSLRLNESKNVSKEKEDNLPYDASDPLSFYKIKKWLKQIINELESIVLFDDDLMPYIVQYIDQTLSTHNYGPEDSLMLNMTSAVIEIVDKLSYLDIGASILKKVKKIEKEDYKKILTLCVNNNEQRPFYIFKQVKDRINLGTFLKILLDLEENKLINIQRLKFTTVEDITF